MVNRLLFFLLADSDSRWEYRTLRRFCVPQDSESFLRDWSSAHTFPVSALVSDLVAIVSVGR